MNAEAHEYLNRIVDLLRIDGQRLRRRTWHESQEIINNTVVNWSLVRFPATPGTLVVLGQNSLFHIASVYPAAKWVPSINKAVRRVCALYAASCSGISPGGLKWFLYVQCLLGEEGRVSTSVDTRL